jgi:hypothetical protein
VKLLSVLDDLLRWLREALQKLSGGWSRSLAGHYQPQWHWDRSRKRWVYGGSEEGYPLPDGTTGKRKSHICTESVIARILG